MQCKISYHCKINKITLRGKGNEFTEIVWRHEWDKQCINIGNRLQLAMHAAYIQKSVEMFPAPLTVFKQQSVFAIPGILRQPAANAPYH